MTRFFYNHGSVFQTFHLLGGVDAFPWLGSTILDQPVEISPKFFGALELRVLRQVISVFVLKILYLR